MKKLILLFVLTALILCFAGCDESPKNPDSDYVSDIPKAEIIINDSKKDTENDVLIFKTWSERERYVCLHYKIEGETPEYDIRIRVETRSGEDDYNISEEYKTLSDEIFTKKSGKWHRDEIFIATSNLYFFRVTIYNGKNILATKTFYTPKKEAVYSEIPQEVPEYRPMELTEKEREFYELCSHAVFDYAEKVDYSEIHEIEGYLSSDGTKLFVSVSYRLPWTEYLAINVSDSTDYSASYEPYDTEGLESFLLDYYYVIEELAEKMKN